MNRFLQKWLDAAPALSDILPGVPILELAGENRVLIENHSGVTRYSPEEIGVRVRFGKLVICGVGLHLVSMRRGSLVISGNIMGITLERGNCHG